MTRRRRVSSEAAKMREARRMAAALATQAHEENDARIMGIVQTGLDHPRPRSGDTASVPAWSITSGS